MYDQIAYAISNRRYMIQDTRCVKKKLKVQMGEQKCYKSVTTIYKFTMTLCVQPL